MNWKIFSFILAVIVILLVGGGYFIFQKNNQQKKAVENLQNETEELKQELETLKKQIGETQKDQEENSQTKNTEDAYAGWQTYTNSDIGYSLRYPAGWTLEETNRESEITGNIVKFITIRTPDNLYLFTFGIKGVNDTFGIFERTGIGAGDCIDYKEMTVLETLITVTKLVFENKAKEIFYPNYRAKTPDGKYEFYASFHYGQGVNFDELDILSLDYTNQVEKILTSIQLLTD